MGRPIIRIAIDPGYSSLKVVIEGVLLTLPCDVIENTGNEDKFISDKEANYAAITVFGKTYLVGNYARKLLLEENRQHAQDVNLNVLNDFERFTSTYFEVSMKAAIGIALAQYCDFSQRMHLKPEIHIEDLPDCDIYLSICVPQAVFDMGPKGPMGLIKQRMYDKHEFTLDLAEKSYDLKFSIVKNCKFKFQSQVVSALVGTLVDEFDTEMGIINLENTMKPILVIDGGYKTVGIFKLSQIDSVEEAESNPDFAMAKVDQRVAEIMAERGRSDIKCYNIQELYDNNEEVVIIDNGETKYITINRDREEVAAEMCGALIDYLRKKYNNLLPIKQILVTGGTGAAYFGTLLNYINTQPEMAHLRGRVHLAEYKFYQQDAHPMHAIVCGLYKQFKKYLDASIEEKIPATTASKPASERRSNKPRVALDNSKEG